MRALKREVLVPLCRCGQLAEKLLSHGLDIMAHRFCFMGDFIEA